MRGRCGYEIGDRVIDFVTPSLEPGEIVEATLSFAETGSSYWVNLVRAPIGLIASSFKVASRALVVTDRRLTVLELGGVPARPQSVRDAFPRTSVRAGAFTRGPLSGSLTIEGPSGPMAFNIRRHWLDEASALVAAIGTSPK